MERKIALKTGGQESHLLIAEGVKLHLLAGKTLSEKGGKHGVPWSHSMQENGCRLLRSIGKWQNTRASNSEGRRDEQCWINLDPVAHYSMARTA